MNDVAPTAPRRARWRLLVPLVLASGVALAGWFGWQGWQARQQQAQERALDDARQIDALGQRMDTLRGDLHAQGRLLQDAAASNRVLRDEVIPLYYDRDHDGLPSGWIKRMKRTIRTLGWRFNADRMVMDYTLKCYIPAAGGTSSDMRDER